MEEAFLGDYLSAGHVDGALLALPRLGEPLLARLAQTHLPLVVLGRPLGYEAALSWVAIDDKAGAETMVKYLIAQGRSRIGTVTGPSTPAAAATASRATRSGGQEVPGQPRR